VLGFEVFPIERFGGVNVAVGEGVLVTVEVDV
jgi:hypothetical protein